MAQEGKELLFKDLCARLPYGVKGIITYDKSNTTFTVEGTDNNVLHLSDAEECYVEDFKPYLRPMSSMIEDEYKELRKIIDYYGLAPFEFVNDWEVNYNIIDWLNARHFDYRGLIERGLAIEAHEGMYNIKEK